MHRSHLLATSAVLIAVVVAAIVQDTRPLLSDELPGAGLQATAEEQCLAKRGAGSELPPRPFTSDGCSLWPDGDWLQCCVAHDIDYWCGGTTAQRAASDLRLKQCVAAAGHAKTGAVMEIGVYLAGASWLPTPWRWGYGWPWLSGQATMDK